MTRRSPFESFGQIAGSRHLHSCAFSVRRDSLILTASAQPNLGGFSNYGAVDNRPPVERVHRRKLPVIKSMRGTITQAMVDDALDD